MRQLACILIALAVVGVYGDEPDKLVNGIPTEIEKYPHCVSIRVNNNHFCGGSMINDQFVLTAAHCVVPLLSDPSLRNGLTVVTGTTYLNSGGQAHKVANMWYHDSYNPRTLGRGHHDIGILKLSGRVVANSKQSFISLPTSDVVRGQLVTIAAWGSTSFRGSIHNNLQYLSANAMEADTCQRYHTNFMPIHKNEICTLIAQGTGLCNGDSGSGMIRGREIVGLVSGGKPCAQGVPDVCTKVFPYLPWIKQKMAL